MSQLHLETPEPLFDPRSFTHIVSSECRRAMRSDIPMSVALIRFAPELTQEQRERVALEISSHLRRGGDALCLIDDTRLGAILADATAQQARLFLDAIRRYADHLDGPDPLLSPPGTVIFAGCVSSAQPGELTVESLLGRAESALGEASPQRPVVQAESAGDDLIH